jgi:glutamate synthase (ferredoxin)
MPPLRQAAILVLSDRVDAEGNPTALTAENSYIPPLLAIGAVHHHLIRNGLRMHTSLLWIRPSAGAPTTLPV